MWGIRGNDVPLHLTMRQLAAFLLFLLLLLSCTDGERMRQRLNDLQAANQADSLLTDDSLALALTDYFDRHGTPNEQMLAHYLLGRTYADMGEAPAALGEYHRAAECADTTSSDCDYRLLARIHGQTANLFYYQALYKNQLAELVKTERYAWKANDSVIAINTLNEKAFAYRQMKMLDSAYVLRNKAVLQFHEAGYHKYAAVTEGLLIPIQIELGLFEEAGKSIKNYESFSGLFDENGNIESGREIYYYYKGLYYLNKNLPDSAEILLRKELRDAKDLNNQLAGSKGLMMLFKNLQKKDSVLKYAETCYNLNDSVTKHFESDAILRTNAIYNYERNMHIANQKTIEAEKAKYAILLLLLVIIIILFAVYFVYAQIRKRQEKMFQKYQRESRQLQQLNALHQTLKAENAQQETVINELEGQIEQLRTSVNNYKKENSQRIKVQIEESLRDAYITRKFVAMENPPFPKPTEEDWTALCNLVEQEIPCFHSTLQSENCSLTVSEYRISVLVRLHFKPSSIALFMDKDLSHISKIRQRLYQKLFQSEGSSKDFDKKILSIF